MGYRIWKTKYWCIPKAGWRNASNTHSMDPEPTNGKHSFSISCCGILSLCLNNYTHAHTWESKIFHYKMGVWECQWKLQVLLLNLWFLKGFLKVKYLKESLSFKISLIHKGFVKNTISYWAPGKSEGGTSNKCYIKLSQRPSLEWLLWPSQKILDLFKECSINLDIRLGQLLQTSPQNQTMGLDLFVLFPITTGFMP